MTVSNRKKRHILVPEQPARVLAEHEQFMGLLKLRAGDVWRTSDRDRKPFLQRLMHPSEWGKPSSHNDVKDTLYGNFPNAKKYWEIDGKMVDSEPFKTADLYDVYDAQKIIQFGLNVNSFNRPRGTDASPPREVFLSEKDSPVEGFPQIRVAWSPMERVAVFYAPGHGYMFQQWAAFFQPDLVDYFDRHEGDFLVVVPLIVRLTPSLLDQLVKQRGRIWRNS